MLISLLPIAAILLAATNLQADSPDCREFQFTQPLEPELNETEKFFVCRKSWLEGSEVGAWAEIPRAQALLHLKGFLQARGYLHSKIQEYPDRVEIAPGEITRLKSWKIEGTPPEMPEIDVTRKREVLNQPLSPKLLSELESWVTRQLQENGYPCAKARAAQNDDGTAIVRVNAGPKADFQPIELTGRNPPNPEILRRHDPFSPDQEYNRMLAEISVDRVMSEGVLDRTGIAAICGGPSTPLRQEVSNGDPRIFGAGFNLNTEEIGKVEIRLRQPRIGENASIAEIGGSASSKIQDAHLFFEWHPFGPSSRAALTPEIEVLHRNENPFEVGSERARLRFQNQWDSRAGFSLNWTIGPRYDWIQPIRSDALTSQGHALFLETKLEFLSHSFETYEFEQRGGYQVNLTALYNDRSVLSNFSAPTIELEFERIWNLLSYDPSLLVIGWRGQAGATFTDQSRREIPPNFLHYLGGIANLRGFTRLELPDTTPGALTLIYSGLEIRPKVLPWNLYPMVFMDFGMLGSNELSLDPPVYLSPGVGLNWRSPVGPFRATLARGLKANTAGDGHWKLYLSYGIGF